MGIKLDLWLPHGDTRAPEVVLPEYDIVLAAGRSAIEAMACGCALLPISQTACLDFVDPLNFYSFQNQNFSPKLTTGHFTAESVIKALESYHPDRTATVTAMIRSECTLDNAVDSLEPLYLKTVDEFRKPNFASQVVIKNEFHAIANYIQSIMPIVRDRERLLAENYELESRAAGIRLQIDQALAEKDGALADKDRMLAEKNHTITILLGSRSMRVTRPIRVLLKMLRDIWRAVEPN
jgi:hypothetical protein